MQQSAHSTYTVVPIKKNGVLADLTIKVGARTWNLLGPAGVSRELKLLPTESHDDLTSFLPVFIGSGTGAAIRTFMEQYDGPFAVIDKEHAITALTGAKQMVESRGHCLWVDHTAPDEALRCLTQWQNIHDARPLLPIVHPAWLRLDRPFYAKIKDTVESSRQFDFWGKLAYPRFTTRVPRILLVTSQYFLMGEVIAALDRMQAPYALLNINDDSLGQNEFVERLLTAVVTFKPDFALTINHLGVDREGVLMELLERLQLPLASWFVDNPHLILHLYTKLVSRWTALFTWDADNISSLKTLGFEHVFHLPLGTDPTRFAPPANTPSTHALKADVSFVGNSMVYKVAQRMKAGRFPAAMLKTYKHIAAAFGASNERDVRHFLEQSQHEVLQEYTALHTPEQRLAYETMITWEATRQYRTACVRQILPFAPLIVGDAGWHTTFRHEALPWRAHAELSYYSDLPWFYPLSSINFNCTSKQMKGAVNQRVFDVPACGAFLLTDQRSQMDELFEPHKEVAFYAHPEEVPSLIRFYLANPNARHKISLAARRRILAEHTYEHRLQCLMDQMRTTFGRP